MKVVQNYFGFSLIETLVTTGILSIVGLGASSLILIQSKQVSVLESKLDTLSFKSILTKGFSQTISGCVLVKSDNSSLTFSGAPTSI